MPINFIEGGTYIINSDEPLSSNLSLPANVTLIFQGGKFTGSATITTGSQT